MTVLVTAAEPRLPDRPRRRMASTKKIARHWGLPDRTCWRCGREGDVERAHIIDRFMGDGLDGEQNLALLCGGCHRLMPIIEPDDCQRGIDWCFAAFKPGQLRLFRSVYDTLSPWDAISAALAEAQRLYEADPVGFGAAMLAATGTWTPPHDPS